MRSALYYLLISMSLPFFGSSQNQLLTDLLPISNPEIQLSPDVILLHPEKANLRDEGCSLIGQRNELYDPVTFAYSERDSTNYHYNGEQLIESNDYSFDGTDWLFINKSTYQYNNQGRLSIRHNLTPNGIILDSTSRFLYEYDENGNTTIQIQQSYQDDEWKNASISGYEYNEDDLLVLCYTRSADASGDWSGLLQREFAFEYNSEGYLTMETARTALFDVWRNLYRLTHEYPAENSQVTTTYYGGDSLEWFPDQRSTHTYDTDRLLISTINEQYNDSLWQFTNRISYERNEADEVIFSSEELWDTPQNSWVNHKRITTEYIADDSIFSLTQIWDYTQHFWHDEQRIITAFNNVIPYEALEITQNWTGERWENFNRTTLLRNEAKQEIFNFNEGWHSILGWLPQERQFYYYDETTSLSDLESHSLSLQIFPNPGNGIVNIKFDEMVNGASVYVYNLQGQLCYKEKISGPVNWKKLNLEQLSTGTYILQLNAGEQTSVQKIQIAL